MATNKAQAKKGNGQADMAICNIVIAIALIIIAALLPKLLLGTWGDTAIFYEWYVYMLFCSIASLPLAKSIMPNCRYSIVFSKVLGFLIPGFFTWAVCAMAGIGFTRTACYAAMFIYAAANIAVGLLMAKQGQNPWKLGNGGAVEFLEYEAAFFVMFLFWVYIIGFCPSAYGTEKFMDYAFLQKMLVSDALPPEDPWYAGSSINYYYGGQYYAAYIAKSMVGGATKAEYAYNMMRGLIPALMSVGIFAAAKELIMDGGIKRAKADIFAALSATVAVFGGNGHYIIYGLLGLGNSESYSYWFPDSTRYIGYSQGYLTSSNQDQTIHEFPCYSFVLGDLHAHMVNTMFVVLLIAVLYSLLKKQGQEKPRAVKQLIAQPQLYMAGLLLGVYNWTNYWDFIIYMVVIAVTLLAARLMADINGEGRAQHKLPGALQAIFETALQMAIVMAMALLCAYPFTSSFESIFKGVGVAQNHSPIYQLLILWAIPTVPTVAFIIMALRKMWKGRAFNAVSPSEMFVFILGCCAIGLVAIPEIVYVRDIYEATHARANTMFKLTYQAFIMFSIISGPILATFTEKSNKVMKVAGYTFTCLLTLTCGYFINCVNAWMPGITSPAARTGTSALCYLNEPDFVYEKDALLWMEEKSESGEITGTICEAPGDSYTAYERVSVITGLSTPAGWTVHEWLWRDDYQSIATRTDEIDALYQSGGQAAKKAIMKYDIDYIFFGQREKEKYGAEKEKDVRALGEAVYDDGYTVIIKTDR